MKPARRNRCTTLMREARAVPFKMVSAPSWLHQVREKRRQKKEKRERKSRNKAHLLRMYDSRLTCLLYDSLSPPTGRTMTWAGDNHNGLRGEDERETIVWASPSTSSQLPVVYSSSFFTLSPFASKVFSQDCDHSFQRAQHGPVDHHWPVRLAVTPEMRRKMTVIDKSKAAVHHPSEGSTFLHVSYD